MERSREIKSKPRLTLPSNWLMIALVGAFLVAAAATAILTYAIVRDLVSTWNTIKIPDFAGEEPQSLEAILPSNLVEQGNMPLQPANGPAPVPWDGNRRVTVLVMGLDYRDWESGQGAPRTTDSAVEPRSSRS